MWQNRKVQNTTYLLLRIQHNQNVNCCELFGKSHGIAWHIWTSTHSFNSASLLLIITLEKLCVQQDMHAGLILFPLSQVLGSCLMTHNSRK